jgi:tetratricopeptide (TPR) repeat protein
MESISRTRGYETLGDRRGTADACWRLAATLQQEGDYRAALALSERAYALFHEIDDQHSLVNVARHMAYSNELLGDRGRARALYEENLHRARTLDNEYIEASSLGSLAMNAAGDGRTKEALSLTKEHLPIAMHFGSIAVAEAFCRVAFVLAHAGRSDSAAQAFAYSEALLDEMGAGDTFWVRRENRTTEARIRETIDDEAFAQAWDEGQALTLDEAVALALESLG